MSDQPYWLSYRARPNGAFIVLGPFATYEQAMSEREKVKRTALGDYYGTPFTAASKEEALAKAPLH